MRLMLAAAMAALVAGLIPAIVAQEGKAAAAKAQIAVLGKAVDTYRLKYTEFPVKLKALVEKKLVLPDAIIDPWGKEFQYDVAGKRNHGKTPDIWAVTPSKELIGNWVEKRK